MRTSTVSHQTQVATIMSGLGPVFQQNTNVNRDSLHVVTFTKSRHDGETQSPENCALITPCYEAGEGSPQVLI